METDKYLDRTCRICGESFGKHQHTTDRCPSGVDGEYFDSTFTSKKLEPVQPTPSVSEKERLKRRFNELHCFNEMNEDSVTSSANRVFDFFYSEIEKRDKRLKEKEEMIMQANGFIRQYEFGDSQQIELCIAEFRRLANGNISYFAGKENPDHFAGN